MRTEDAVGQVLCHDITQIIKGVTKDAVFRKGHIIREEDIPVLLSVGKDHIYIWENNENMLHENDAAQILYEISAGENIRPSAVKEGKIELIATCDGLLKIDRSKLIAVNSLGEPLYTQWLAATLSCEARRPPTGYPHCGETAIISCGRFANPHVRPYWSTWI